MPAAPSYVSGTSSVPLLGETIGQHFDRAAARWPDREALVVRHQNVRWSYRELKHRADALAAGLIALGLKPGDRIGIWSPNTAEWVLTQFASAKAGLILVTVNPAYRVSELRHALRKSGCKALVLATGFKGSDYLEMLRTLAPELKRSAAGDLHANELPELRHVIHLGDHPEPGMLRFSEVAKSGGARETKRLEDLAEQLQFDDPINIQFTSGTTGAPKGATLTHHNILNNAFFVAEAMGLREGDRLCIPVPLYHCFGMVMSSLACATHGATMVFPSAGFEPLAVLEAVEEEKCTALHGVPTMFIAEMEHPEFKRFDLSTLRAGIMAGSPCPIEVMRRVMDCMHMRDITIAYGMTETSPVSFQSAIDDPIERRVSTVGLIHPHLEVKIVDSESRVVPRGTPGELLTRGYSVMLGYWDDAEQTAEAIDANGWMHTGDLATIDAEGYCNIVGRIKDMVIRGGENIYPREVEEFLFQHPKIEAAQVVGLPDTRYGEELCAWIKLRAGESLTEQQVRDFCQGQIAHYKIPKYICFVSEFPLTVTGKVQKFLIRERMMQELGLRQEQTA
ncbi:MAG TPA: AMP-binding protein [Candidatus Angelobacter sp.]|nr:AMP-binding protein [Candidatus Angelobacter sp.]